MIASYLIWVLASVVAVASLVFAFIGVRRRIERGRPARFSLGIGLTDVIESLTGKELSTKTQATIFIVALATGLLVLAVGIGLMLMRQGAAA